MKPLISVIVPVYNVEKYLHTCVESILSQTYENIEVILIDDGARDSSPAICDSFAEKDARVRVIHKENGGVAKARNTGIEEATGEFYCFIDADDHVHPEYISCMYSLREKTDADISMCSYIYKWPDGTTKLTRNTGYSEEHTFCDSGKEALGKMLYGKIYAPSCYGKLFAKHIKAHFPKYSIGEDMLACTKYLAEAENVAMVNKPFYFYMQHDESVMHTVNPDKIFDLVVTGDEMIKIVAEKCPESLRAAKYYIIEKNMIALMKLYGMEGQEDKIKHIGNNIKKYRMSVITDKNAELRTKIACILSFAGIDALCRLRNKITK